MRFLTNAHHGSQLPIDASNVKYALLINKHQKDSSSLIKFFLSDYQIKGSDYRVLDWFKIPEEIINTDFVKNLCDRDMSFVCRKFVDARHSDVLTNISSGYNLSRKEYERVEALTQCFPEYEKFVRLGKSTH